MWTDSIERRIGAALRAPDPRVRIWRKSPRELVETERTGVGVLFASWSGAASAWLATLVRLVEQHPAPIRLFVMDSDDATRDSTSRRSALEVLGPGSEGIHGWGETFGFRDGAVVAVVCRPLIEERERIERLLSAVAPVDPTSPGRTSDGRSP